MSPDLKDVFDDAGRTPPAGRGFDADEVVRRGARIRTRRRVLTGAATLGVAAIVVGGSVALIGPGLGTGTAIAPGDTPSSSPSTTPSVDVTPSDSPSTSPSDQPTPTLSSTSHSCTGDDVTLTLGDGGGAAGTWYYPVLVKAKPDRSCTIAGTPVVYALHDVGLGTGPAYALIGPASDMSSTDGGGALVQGATVASFMVGISASQNYDAAVCLPVPTSALRVTLPDAPIHLGPYGPAIEVPLPDGVTVCSGNVSGLGDQLRVGSVVPGPDGQ